ncbi:MAG: T9SS type A sorting domain-containing protein [Vicingaceae bacterium]
MRHLLILFICLTFFTTSNAQPSSGGPDNFGYTYKTSMDPNGPSYQWFDISTIGTFVGGLSDDNFVGPYPISNFPFYSSTPSQLYIGSNGYVAFNGTNIASTGGNFPFIPTSGGPNNYIAPLLTDLTFAGNSSNAATAYYYNQGDTICISYEKVPFWYNNANQYFGENTFQIILNKADSSITFNYKLQVANPDPTYTNDYLTIGIENATGADGLQYYRGTTFPPTSFSVKFYYPNIVQPVTDIKASWVNNENNGGIFIPRNSSYQPTLNVENIGNQAVNSRINFNYEFYHTGGILIGSDTGSIASLGVGEDSSFTFSQPLSAINADRYYMKTYIEQVANDNIRLNDTLTTLVKVVDTSSVPLTLDYSEQFQNAGAISWSGGNAGVGIYVEPPYYPARITAANFYISGFGGGGISGFHSVLYDDNARGGGPGTVLDSAFIPSFAFTTGSYYKDSLRNNVVINSGGVYLLWLMGPGGIQLGRTIDFPASQQTYEFIGGAWAPYRDKDTEEFMMNIEIQPLSVDLADTKKDQLISRVFPNPSSNMITVELKQALDYQEVVSLMNVKGQKVNCKILRYPNQLKLYKGNLAKGQYFLRIGQETKSIQFTD